MVVELEDGRTVEAAVAQVPAELGHDYGPAPTFAGMSVEPFAVWVAPARGSVRAATFLAYDAAGKLIGKNRLDCVPDTVCG